MNRGSSRNRSPGFTFVELLLALALGAVTRADVIGLPKGEKIAEILHLR